MTAKKNLTPKTAEAAELRWLAEARLNGRQQPTTPLQAADALRLVHELEVHQIELEMQNEELIATRTELETALSQYTDLYDFAPVGYFTLTREGKIQKTNFAGAKLLGTDRSTVNLRRFGQFVAFDSQPAFSAFIKRVFAPIGNYKEICELALQAEDSITHWVHIEASTGNTQSEVCHAIVVDITERKQAELQIQGQLRRLNALRMIDTAINASFDTKVVLEIVLKEVISQLRVDAALILLLNSSNQHLEFAVVKGFHTPNSSQLGVRLMDDYVSGQVGLENKTIHIPNLAEVRHQFSRAELLKDENFVEYFRAPLISKGLLMGVLEIFHRSALDPDPEWLGFLETLAGQAAIAIDNAKLFEDLQRSNAELEQRVAQRTAELYQTNLELEYANRTKDEFLANMSHELRTPLNSILGLSETLLEQLREPLSERQQRSLQVIESSGHHLLDLINDVLDLSKIEAGKFDYYPQMVTVDEVCQISLSFVKENAVKKSIMLNYEPLPQASKIYADPRRLKQILVNLLSNAVKFTPEYGEVNLKVTADAEQDLMRFSVSDTGIGIAPADLQRLFIPFTQVDSSLSRQYEGTGLGLALIQKLTDLHGGSVEVESEAGKGSRFTIKLRWGQELINQQASTQIGNDALLNKNENLLNTPLQPLREQGTILLAEDNRANVLMMEDYLASRGYQVLVAHDGLETIEKAQAHPPNLILMDIQMPVLNGLEAISHLRADPRFGSTPIIALTALAMPGDRERCLAVGANEYMSKPVSLKTLLKTIRELLNESP